MVSPEVETYDLAPWPLMIFPIPFMAIAIAALGMRLWVRCVMTRSFGWDDGWLIASFVGYYGECITLIVVGHIQLTQGITGPVILLGKLNFVGVACYIFNQICFKLSLAVFFLRFLVQKWQRYAIFVTVAIFIMYAIALLFVTMFECGDPTSPNLANATCLDWDTILGPINYVGATLNAIVDWIFALSPILVIRTLRMSKNGKGSVMALVLLAVSGSIISVLRIPFVDGLNPSGSYWTAAADRIAYMSVAEGGVGITAVSLATLRPLIRAWRQKTRSYPEPDSDKHYIRDVGVQSWSIPPDYPNLRQFSHIIEDVEMDDREEFCKYNGTNQLSSSERGLRTQLSNVPEIVSIPTK